MFERHRKRTERAREPLGVLIAAARRGIKQAVGARLRGLGLSPQQFWVLMAIDEQQGLSLRELCERRRMDAPTASRVVAALAIKRLLRSGGDRADRRRCRLELTAEGDALACRLRGLLEEQRAALVDGLSARDERTLRELLRRVIANLSRFARGASLHPPRSDHAALES